MVQSIATSSYLMIHATGTRLYGMATRCICIKSNPNIRAYPLDLPPGGYKDKKICSYMLGLIEVAIFGPVF